MRNIALNHATVRQQADMLAFLDLCVDREIDTVSIWSDEIDKVGETMALEHLERFHFHVAGYNRIGPFTPEILASAEVELQRAARFKADYALLFTGGLTCVDRDLKSARYRAEAVIGDLLPIAKAAGMTLAIEPLHPMLTGDRALISSLTHANDLCDRLGDGIGIVVDVHHVWWDERLDDEIERAIDADRLLGFHINDWLIPTLDLLNGRGMMGDGVIDLAGIDATLTRLGYIGPAEVEIFSDSWWKRDAAEVIDIALARSRQILGDAEK